MIALRGWPVKLTKNMSVCPACEDEGKGAPQPLTAFYAKRRRRPDGSIRIERSYLCRVHTDKVNAAQQERRLDPSSPDYDPTYHEQVKKWKRDYRARKLDPSSPDYDPDFRGRLNTAQGSYRSRRLDPSSPDYDPEA